MSANLFCASVICILKHSEYFKKLGPHGPLILKDNCTYQNSSLRLRECTSIRMGLLGELHLFYKTISQRVIVLDSTGHS